MIYDYEALKSAPDYISIGVLLKFLNPIINACSGPSDINSECPPVVFWWWEKDKEAVNELIIEAVKNYKWEVPWVIEAVGNNKWLLFPQRLREVEKSIKGTNQDDVAITTGSEEWLMQNDPEFGRRANKDLRKFEKYFRAVIENYLLKKENKIKYQ